MINLIHRAGMLLLLTMFSQVYAQRSPNININAELVSDLQDAAARLHLDGAVIIGDTVNLEYHIELLSLSLFIYCNYLQNGSAGIKISPYPADTPVYNADRTGMAGREITIYCRQPVKATLDLPGGAGDKGKQGRNGKNGKKPVGISQCCSPENKGEAGQAGGNGFAGGIGGKVMLRSVSPAMQSQLFFTGKGGTGGQGGAGGKGGLSYMLYSAPGHPDQRRIQERKEADGVTGKPGVAGSTQPLDIQIISNEAFTDELHKFGVDSLGGSQPAFTTLITLAPKTRPGANNADPNRPTENTNR